MSYIGNTNVGGMYFGDTKIGKAYLGDDLVYSSGPPQPKITVTTHTINVTASSSYKAFYVRRSFVVGAEYKFEYSTNARNGGYVRIGIQSNGQSGNMYANSGTYTKVVTTNPDPQRFYVGFSSPAAGTCTVTITETIYPS